MKKLLFYSMFFGLVFSFFTCSSTKDGANKINPVKYKKKLEKVTRLDFLNKTRTILQNKYQYIFVRSEDNEGQQYIETDWQVRTPSNEEYDAGIVEARSKVFLTAYPRELSNPQGMWISTIEIINEVKLEGALDWMQMPMSKAAKKYYDRIVDDLNLEFRMGIRQF